MFLSATTQSLEIDLNGAVAANQLPVVVSYVDVNQSTLAMSAMTTATTQTNSTTAVTIVAAPGATTTRQVKFISVKNSDTSPVLLWIQLNDNSTLREITKCTLAVGDTLQYTDTAGWQTLDSNGSKKFSINNVTGNLTVGGTLGVTGLATFSAGISIPTGQNVTGAGTALVGTTVNGNTITTGTGTLTLGAGKTTTISNTLTLTATDGSTLAIGTGGTLAGMAYQSGSWASPGAAIGTGTPVAAAFTTLNTTSDLSVDTSKFLVQGANGAVSLANSGVYLYRSSSTSGTVVTTFDINGGSTFSPFTIRVTAATVDATTVGTTNKGAWWLYLVIVKNGTAGTVTLLDSGGDTGSFTAPVLAGDSATGHQTWTCTTVGTRNRLIQGVEIINYTGGNGVSS